MVLRAFRQIPLPASNLTIAPVHGTTLVNIATIFSTHADRFQRTVHLLGRAVTLDITPSSYAWTYGDGSAQTTTSPGHDYAASLPVSAYLSHEYLEAGSVRPAVATTWSARWRLGGGPWRPVGGTVTIAGAPRELRIRTATPTLVG